MLERRELGLRQRFESIYEKLTDTRNLLNRVETNDTAKLRTRLRPTPKPQRNHKDTALARCLAATAQRMLARRRLRVAGSLQNVVQSADEVKGVAEAFDDLSEELTNNRIDNPDLKSRLGEQIAQPLHLIAETAYARPRRAAKIGRGAAGRPRGHGP